MMNDQFLKDRLRRMIRRQQWLALSWKLALCWTLAALAGGVMIWWQHETGWASTFTLPLLAGYAYHKGAWRARAEKRYGALFAAEAAKR